MSLEIHKKVHKKLRTKCLNKTSSLRRKIRKTSRRKRKRRRNGNVNGCGCTNNVNTTITFTKAPREDLLTSAKATTTTAIRKAIRTRRRVSLNSTRDAVASVRMFTVPIGVEKSATGASPIILRSCKVNVNNEKKQKLQNPCMHNYCNNNINFNNKNNNETSCCNNNATVHNVKCINKYYKNNIHDVENRNITSSYTTSTSSQLFCNANQVGHWQECLQSKQTHLILQNILTTQNPQNTQCSSYCTESPTGRRREEKAETLDAAVTSPFVAHNNSTKKVQLFLIKRHQKLLVYLQRFIQTPTSSVLASTQPPPLSPSPDTPTQQLQDLLEFGKSVKTITAGIKPTMQKKRTQLSSPCNSSSTATAKTSGTIECEKKALTSFEKSRTLCYPTYKTAPISSTSSLSSLSSSWMPLSSFASVVPLWPNAAASALASGPEDTHSSRSLPPTCSTTSATCDISVSHSPRRKKIFQGLFMTLLVLSICNNNVLETSAASMRTLKSEISFTLLEQMKLPAIRAATSLPHQLSHTLIAATTAKATTTTSPPTTKTKTGTINGIINVNENNTSFSSTSSLLQSDENENEYGDQHRIPKDTLTQTFPLTQTNHIQDAKDYTQMKKNNNNNEYQYLLAPKQKRQQRVQQLPQYLTSTQETSFSQNGMALDTGNNRTFPSLSIVDGRLTVPMDNMDQQQQQQHHDQQRENHNLHGENHSTSGSSTGSSGNSGFLVDGNEMMPFPKRHSMPVFDFGMPRNITARTGHMEAVIKCRVDRLDDKSVSWIRKRDLHILTVGKTTYTSDKRFQVTESKDSREWTLHVKSPQARDSGIYECQVNTEPKMSMAFQLNIIEISPDVKAVITGPAALYFKVGSAIILTCLVHQPSVKDIGPIHWYRGEYLITPFDVNDESVRPNDFGTSAALTSKSNSYADHSDGDMYDSTVDEEEEQMSQILTNEITKDFTQRIAMEQQLCDTIKSRLRISNAQKSDSGNYTCQPTTASSASVMVHVINDENPAAMQKSGAAPAAAAPSPTLSYSSHTTAAGVVFVYYIIHWCRSYSRLTTQTLYLYSTSMLSSLTLSVLLLWPSSSSAILLSSTFVMMLVVVALFSYCRFHVINNRIGSTGIGVKMENTAESLISPST